MSFQELFRRCKQREPQAQRALYELFKAKLMGLCRRYTKDRDDAKDMLQETFIKIFSKIDQVESAEKCESWMKSIAVRTAIDHYNKMKRMDLGSFPDPGHDVAGTDHEWILDQIADEYLIALINDLPEGCRIVFNLFEVEGYSHAEIATLLEITEGTSRSQLHHAKYLLKQQLKRLGIKRYEKFA